MKVAGVKIKSRRLRLKGLQGDLRMIWKKEDEVKETQIFGASLIYSASD